MYFRIVVRTAHSDNNALYIVNKFNNDKIINITVIKYTGPSMGIVHFVSHHINIVLNNAVATC